MASSDTSGDVPVTFADLGLTKEAATVETFVGTRRPISSLSTFEWLFLGIALLTSVGALGLTVERIVDIPKNSVNGSATTDVQVGNSSPETDLVFAILLLINIGLTVERIVDIPKNSVNGSATTDVQVGNSSDEADLVFATLLLINIVFIIFYILNGVFGERAFEVFAFVIGVFIILLYCIVNYIQVPGEGTENIIKLTRLVLINVFGPVDIVLGLFIARQYHDSKNLIFRTVGANVALQELCQKVFLGESLLKFDLQLTMSLVFLILNDGFNEIGLEEKLVLAIGVSYGIFWTLVGWLAMRYESKPLAWVFLLTSWMQPAYIVYKLVDVGMYWQNMISVTIVLCSFFGLVLRGCVFAVFILVYRNFGKGLKEKVLNISTSEETRKVVTPQGIQDEGQQIGAAPSSGPKRKEKEEKEKGKEKKNNFLPSPMEISGSATDAKYMILIIVVQVVVTISDRYIV